MGTQGPNRPKEGQPHGPLTGGPLPGNWSPPPPTRLERPHSRFRCRRGGPKWTMNQQRGAVTHQLGCHTAPAQGHWVRWVDWGKGCFGLGTEGRCNQAVGLHSVVCVGQGQGAGQGRLYTSAAMGCRSGRGPRGCGAPQGWKDGRVSLAAHWGGEERPLGAMLGAGVGARVMGGLRTDCQNKDPA